MRRSRCCGVGAAFLLLGIDTPARAGKSSKAQFTDTDVVETSEYLLVGKQTHRSKADRYGPYVPSYERVTAWIFSDVERRVRQVLSPYASPSAIGVTVELSLSPAILREVRRWGLSLTFCNDWDVLGYPFKPPMVTEDLRFEWRAIVQGKGLVAGEGVLATSRTPLTRGQKPLGRPRGLSGYVGDVYQARVKSLDITHTDGQLRPTLVKPERPGGRLRRAVMRIATRLGRLERRR